MKFGLFVPQGWRLDLAGIEPAQHWGVMAGLARRADANEDWTSIWVYDHFHSVPSQTAEATHEAWTLMAAFAAVTGRVRLGQMCTCMAYRNPAYLAKVAATVDIVSEGRVEMGIGAGWHEEEWRAYGYGFPTAGQRLQALREGVEIMRQMWVDGQATYAGEHYTVDRAICAPRPLQGTSSPGSKLNGIPMWVAGGGERKTLRIAAEYADYTNFAGTAEVFAAKSRILRGHCEDIGRDFGQILRSSNFNVVIGANDEDVQDRLAWLRAHFSQVGLPEDVLEEQMQNLANGPLVGTPDQILSRLTELQGLGMTYAILNFAEAAYDTTGIALFERDVIPELVDRAEQGHLWHLGRRH